MNKVKDQPPPWQSIVNDKLAGYMYAMDLGVPTPRLYACSRGIPKITPEVWGTNSFVVKPLIGFNSIGVVVSDNGRDKLTSMPVKTETLADIYRLHSRRSDITNRIVFSPDTTFLVEEYLRPRPGMHNSGIPADVKIDVYDGEILLVHYIERAWDEKTNRLSVKCVKYFDSKWNYLPDVFFGPSVRICPDRVDSPPEGFRLMKDMVLKLANALGVYYRIDMFFTARGPVLGEFTPWSSNGNLNETIACHIAQKWHGDRSPRALQLAIGAKQPDALRGWDTMSTMEKCERVRERQKSIVAGRRKGRPRGGGQ